MEHRHGGRHRRLRQRERRDGGFVFALEPDARKTWGSGLITGEDHVITLIGVCVHSIDANGAMDLAILPAMAYEFLDDAIMPDPPALLTSSFTVRLDSLVEGVNSVPVNWELPAGTWFIAAIPALALAATLRRKARRTIGR